MHGGVLCQLNPLYKGGTIGKWAMAITFRFGGIRLTQPSTFTLTSRPLIVPYDVKVSMLINPYTLAWRTNMVSQFFSLMDATIILSIPLSYRLPCARMVWAFTPKGNFIVRSAYRLTLDMVNKAASGEVSDNHQRNLFWKTLWRLNVPTRLSPSLGMREKTSYPQKITYAEGRRLTFHM